MQEQLGALTEMVSNKLSILLPGFFGSLFSMSFIRPVSILQAWTTLVGGCVAAYYLTPIVSHLTGLNGPREMGGQGLLVGLVAMPILSGLLKIAETFRNDPVGFISRIWPAVSDLIGKFWPRKGDTQ